MNTVKEKSKAAFNQQAATYDKDIKGQHARSLYPVLLEKLSHIPFQSALDLGCGTGEMLKLILQKDPHKELCGIDLSEEMLAVAKSKLPEQVKLLLGDSEALPFPDNAFDLVYCNDSFHHYPASSAPLSIIVSVLTLHIIPMINIKVNCFLHEKLLPVYASRARSPSASFSLS